MLAKLISSISQNSIKSILKLDGKVDEIIEKFKIGCPPKEELIKVIKQKNTFISTLTTIKKVLNSITITGKTLNGIITALQVGVKIIKFLPVPIPPFAPLTITNVLADSLDALGGLLKNGKGSVKMIPQVFGSITPEIDKLIAKLKSLDVALNACIEAQGLTQKELTDSLLNSGQLSPSSGEWILEKDVKYPQLKPTEFPPIEPTPFTDRNGNVWVFTIIEDLSGIGTNTTSNEDLEKQLQPGSTNPLLYRGFKLEIQNDPKNEFSFASRRIKAQNQEKSKIILYNLPDQGYSFSSSVEVLIDEAKFEIDSYYTKVESGEFLRLEEEAREKIRLGVGEDRGNRGSSPLSEEDKKRLAEKKKSKIQKRVKAKALSRTQNLISSIQKKINILNNTLEKTPRSSKLKIKTIKKSRSKLEDKKSKLIKLRKRLGG
tara:strand:+ start:1428 stop:2720 length:1293 start_codon:yes stop_codon:yes gene_type:complete